MLGSITPTMLESSTKHHHRRRRGDHRTPHGQA